MSHERKWRFTLPLTQNNLIFNLNLNVVLRLKNESEGQ
jgi:hypothetical protein